MNVLRASGYTSMPWKNGGGRTAEIVRRPDSDSFGWRVSIASVEQSGPFSRFAGYDRVLVMIDGSGMRLNIDGSEVPLEPLVPHRFAGEAETFCTLTAGPTRDFNVMVRRGAVDCEVSVIRCDSPFPLTATFFYCLSGALDLTDGADTGVVGENDSAILDGTTQLTPREASIIIAVDIKRLINATV